MASAWETSYCNRNILFILCFMLKSVNTGRFQWFQHCWWHLGKAEKLFKYTSHLKGLPAAPRHHNLTETKTMSPKLSSHRHSDSASSQPHFANATFHLPRRSHLATSLPILLYIFSICAPYLTHTHDLHLNWKATLRYRYKIEAHQSFSGFLLKYYYMTYCA